MDIERLLNLAWAAGLFEGEGCITHNGKQDRILTPKLVLCMTDKDSVERFLDIVKSGRILVRKRSELSVDKISRKSKIPYEWRVTGHKECITILRLIWPGLGLRRKARALELYGDICNSFSPSWEVDSSKLTS